MSAETHCPFCNGNEAAPFDSDKRRIYLRCSECALVFVPPAYYLSLEQERAEYDLHENAVGDTGYRKFLSRLSAPLISRLPLGSQGLDFGCGPAPALAAILEEAGHPMSLYDPYYYPNSAVLSRTYDFVCATEVVEHLHDPAKELERLWRLLRPGGWLGVMTKLAQGHAAFAKWHYKNDPTHVCFFSVETWHWWAQRRGAQLEIVGADVILLRSAV